MSKIGKKILALPKGTEIEVFDSGVLVKGPLGEIKQNLDLRGFSVKTDSTARTVQVTPPEKLDKRSRSLWGTNTAIIENMIQGVNKMFEKILEFEGIGYKAEANGKELVLSLGFSHPVKVAIPSGLTVKVDKNQISVVGVRKEQVGSFAAAVRKIRKVEPYKGTGIRYKGEVVKKKAGKKLAGATA
jgi:large subunit ribosomal protein L6